MRNKTTRRVKVEVDGRVFFAHYDGDKLFVIKERRIYSPGKPYSAFYDAVIWHVNHSANFRKGSLVETVHAKLTADQAKTH